jgi:acetyl esterase/lipase
MIIEPVPCEYEDFPESTAWTEGMRTISAEPVKVCAIIDNVVYAERDGMKLTLQIILPYDRLNTPGKDTFHFRFFDAKRPLIVYVQGSAWLEQMILQGAAQLADFARRGYVIAIVRYRPSTVAPFPAQIVDTKAAIRYMKLHAAEYGADPDSCVLWGDSSGGHTAVMAGLTGDDILPCPDYPGVSASVKAVVDYYGPTDISKMSQDHSTMDHIGPDCPEGLFIGGLNVLENPDRVAPTVPMNYVTEERQIPPLFIIHGTKDRLVPFRQSVLLYEKLRDCGKKAEFWRLDKADHAGGEFWSKPVYDLVEDFIRRNI